jgi:hypothetical protein
MINLLVFRGVRPDDNSELWKCFLESRDKLLEIFKNGLLMIPQTFGVITAHALGSSAELGLLPGFLNRSEKIQVWREGIYVIKISIHENKITMPPVELFGIPFIKTTHFRSKQVTAGITGNMNWRRSR